MELQEQIDKLFDSFPEFTKRILGLIDNGYRPLDAYMLAGGEAANRKIAQINAIKLLSCSNVVEYRRLRNKEESNSLIMTRTEMLARLTAVARARLDDIVRIEKICTGFTDEGIPMYINRVVAEASDNIPDEALAGLAEVSQNEHGIKLKMHSPLVAMKQIAEAQGFEPPKKHEITGLNGEAIKIVATSAAEAAASYQDIMG